MPKNTVVLSKTLKTLLLKKKMTAKAFSREIGIPNSTIASYLAGSKATYQLEHIIAIADYFGCSVDFLLRGAEVRDLDLRNLKLEDLFDGFVKIKIQRVLQEPDYDK